VREVGAAGSRSRAVQKFAPAGPDPSFHDRVHSWYLDAAEHDVDARIGRGKTPRM
jgi:hypothetical protein